MALNVELKTWIGTPYKSCGSERQTEDEQRLWTPN